MCSCDWDWILESNPGASSVNNDKDSYSWSALSLFFEDLMKDFVIELINDLKLDFYVKLEAFIRE